ncbi:hypothetical protein CYLTODRAFT_368413 [Cylindrobasidium torrendii FP15055 ss-10]|uniref:MYND-type domain-containing protein n=1 Tax=Cylindrobasidium torrendii FP15055 ss-10 TaxID=1314674 RepID=A0A0D7BN57_9AGAR|nr:hypothetical protein CYLTODRAFT_368413 [Cylindrobasidium torrendii FP15055 ss-10]
MSDAQLLKEAVTMAAALAQNLRISKPLPVDTDFTDAESIEVQTQIKALAILPRRVLDAIYLAFTAKYLAALVEALKKASLSTQKTAVSAWIQAISILPEPKNNSYLRRFLLNNDLVAGLPNLIVERFLAGITWAKPDGLGNICSLIMNTLQWCDTALGDDGHASVSKANREALEKKLAEYIERFKAAGKDMSRRDVRPDLDTIELNRLHGMLRAIEHMPGPPGTTGYYLKSTKDYLLGQIPGQEECDLCMDEEAAHVCSRCKSVRYCSTECQGKAWKEGHRMRCFTCAF